MVTGLQKLRDRFDAILLDLDGSLLGAEAEVTPRTARAVRALEDSGFYVVLCTGRSLAGTRPIHETLGLSTPVVTYNGAWIGHPDGEPERYIPIPDAQLDVLFRVEQECHFSFRQSAEMKYTIMSDHPEHERIAEWFENVVRAAGDHELPTEDIMRISMFFDERDFLDLEMREALWTSLPPDSREALRHEAFPLSLFPNYASSTLHLFEIQGYSRGKAEAFDWLEAKHGIPASRTIALGDHRNDLSMLAEAGLPISLSSAIPEARELAQLVIGHHAEEGFAAWVEAGAPLPANGRGAEA